MEGTRDMLGLVGPLTQRHHQVEVVLAVQHLLQLLVTDRSHLALLSSASLSQWASVAPASAECLDVLGMAVLAIPDQRMDLSIGDAEVQTLLIGTGKALGVDPSGGPLGGFS